MGVDMIWMASAIGLGLLLGVIGYYHSKLAYSAFTLSLTGFVFCSSYIKGLVGGASGGASIEFPVDENGLTNIGGMGNLLFRAVDNMGMLPPHIQLSILLFVGAFFAARIGTWLFTGVAGQRPKVAETQKQRKDRILKEYGYKNGLPY